MNPLTIRRDPPTPDGVFGRLYVPQRGELYTMEDDWLFNRRRVSSIPAGKYLLKRTIYHRHGYPTFEITGVPGRDRILIHPGNTEEDVMGCVGLGLRRGYLTVKDEDSPTRAPVSKRAVLDSQLAFKRFMFWMKGINEVPLHVEWAAGTPK